MASTRPVWKGDNTDFVPEIIATFALDKLVGEFQLANFFTKDTDWEPVQEGETLKIRKRGAFTTKQKAFNTDYALQDPGTDRVSVTLDQHWYVSFAIDDILETVKKGNTAPLEEYLEDAIKTLAERIETNLAEEISNLTNTVGSAGVSITDSLVLLPARKTLATNKTPLTPRGMFLHPEQTNDVLALDKFTTVEKYGSAKPILEGELGKIYGANTAENVYLPSGTTSPTPLYGFVGHPHAIIFATRPIKSAMNMLANGKNNGRIQFDMEKDGFIIRVTIFPNDSKGYTQCNVEALWGTAVLRDEVGVRIISS